MKKGKGNGKNITKAKERFVQAHKLAEIGLKAGQIGKILNCHQTTISRMILFDTYEGYSNSLKVKREKSESKVVTKSGLVLDNGLKTTDISRLNEITSLSLLNSILSEIKKTNELLAKKKFIF